MARQVQVYTFKVTGMGGFPFDMLRYDEAWPASETESGKIEHISGPFAGRGDGEPPVIELKSLHYPTGGRWESFLWRVVGEPESRVIN